MMIVAKFLPNGIGGGGGMSVPSSGMAGGAGGGGAEGAVSPAVLLLSVLVATLSP